MILGALCTFYLTGLGVLVHTARERLRVDGAPATWERQVEVVNAALARRDIGAAERAWRDAHNLALRTRAWLPLADVGGAALRIGTVVGHRDPYRMRARELYLAALSRARADRSVEGVLHVADLFEALGDQEVVRQCLIIAEGLAGQRLRALTDRLADVQSVPVIEP
jgi:hypothetical protein